MPLETDVDYLGDLDPASPGPAEFKSEGDDHFRNLKKALRQSFPGATGPILVMGAATGTDAYVLTPARPLVDYVTNMLVAVKIPAANTTTAPTLNVSSLGPKAIKAVNGGDLVAGDMPANSFQFLLYDGINFVQQAPSKAYVDRVVKALKDYTDQLALAPAFPNQAGNAGKVSTTDGTNVIWQWAQNMPRVPRTANTMLLQADRAKLVDITSGTFTQTFDTAENLGDGWYTWVRNSGTGNITIPASDGRTNWIMYPGEARVFQCDGTALRSIVLNAYDAAMVESGDYVKPPGYRRHAGGLWSGGASGSKGSTNLYKSGGGGGACALFDLPDSAIPNIVPVIIGAGGAPQTAADSPGNPGGNGSFGTLIYAYGGKGGMVGENAGFSEGIGGSAYFDTTSRVLAAPSGDENERYLGGGRGEPQTGESSVWGGGGGGGVDGATPYPGGTSVFGGRGGNAVAAAAGQAGTAPGGGGGATRTGPQSGAGARGELRIRGIV